MRKEERIALLKREVKEISDLLAGIQAFNEVPEVLIDLLYQKTLNLSEGVGMLKQEKEPYSELEDNPTDSASVMFPDVIEQVIEEESIVEQESTIEAQVEDVIEEKELYLEDFEGFKDVANEDSIEDESSTNEDVSVKEVVAEQVVEEEEQAQQPEEKENTPQSIDEEEDKPVIKKVFEQVFRTHSPSSNVTAKKEDFRRLMTLNDRFLFQRELFHGDVGMLNHTIDIINEQEEPELAKAYVREEFKWDEDNLTVGLFMEMIDRHFSE